MLPAIGSLTTQIIKWNNNNRNMNVIRPEPMAWLHDTESTEMSMIYHIADFSSKRKRPTKKLASY